MQKSGKTVNIYIALLVRNYNAEHEGEFALRYVAGSREHARFLRGKTLYKDMKGVRYESLYTDILHTLCAIIIEATIW